MINFSAKITFYCNRQISSPKWLQLGSVKKLLSRYLREGGGWSKGEERSIKSSLCSKCPLYLWGCVGCKNLQGWCQQLHTSKIVWQFLKTISTRNNKNDLPQLPFQVSSVINGGNKSTNVINITNRSTISKPNVKRLQRQCNPSSWSMQQSIQQNGMQQRKRKSHKARTVCWQKKSESVSTKSTTPTFIMIGLEILWCVTPPKQGVKEDIPTIVYKSIYQAFDSHIKINQYNKI